MMIIKRNFYINLNKIMIKLYINYLRSLVIFIIEKLP